MAITQRHKKAGKLMGKYGTEAEALIAAGYSPSYADNGLIKTTKGWQELMERELPDEKLLQVHKEGLQATKVTETIDGEGIKASPDFATRHKYLETAYKVKGSFAPEKHHNINENVIINETPEVIAKAKELLKEKLLNG